MSKLYLTIEAAKIAGLKPRWFRDKANGRRIKPAKSSGRTHLWTMAQIRRIAR